MKEIELQANTKLIIYNEKDYIELNELINAKCISVIKSYENKNFNVSRGIEQLNDLNSDLFINDSKALIMILEREKKIKSIGIFTTDRVNPYAWHTEMIMTKNAVQNCGYASSLLKNAIEEIKSNKGTILTFNIADNNVPSINFHKKFLQEHNIKCNTTKLNGVYSYKALINEKEFIKENN